MTATATALQTHGYDPARQNVFSGPNSLIDYFRPDRNAPLPLVELPPELNPYHADGVRIYAKMLTALPATNVKSLPGKFRRSSQFLPPDENRRVRARIASRVDVVRAGGRREGWRTWREGEKHWREGKRLLYVEDLLLGRDPR